MPVWFAAPAECDHRWQPVSMVFETQLLDGFGRVRVRQPDLTEGRCYFVCTGCASHTYMTTQWLGVRMYGSEDAIPEDQRDRFPAPDAHSRPAWIADGLDDEDDNDDDDEELETTR